MTFLSSGGCSTFRGHKVVPDSVAACRQLSREGVAAMECGQLEHARTLLHKAVETSPTDIDARRQLAEVQWQTGVQREAVVNIEAAVRLDPKHAPTLVRSGEMLMELGATERAMARAEEAILLDATQAGAWALRGRLLRRREEFDRALADFQQSLRFDPHDVEVLLDVAELQYQLGRPQRSLSTLEQALGLSQPGEEPRRALWLAGIAYGAVGRHEDAVARLYAASMRGEPEAALLCHLAQAQSAAGRDDEALATARRALAANGAHQPALALLARLEGGVAGTEAPILR